MENSNLQHLKYVSQICETIINGILEFEPQCEQFVSRFLENRSNAEEISAFHLNSRYFLDILNKLNILFYKYFQPFPIQHPWFQENEARILSIFTDIARLHDLLDNLLKTIPEQESYEESPVVSRSAAAFRPAAVPRSPSAPRSAAVSISLVSKAVSESKSLDKPFGKNKPSRKK